MTDLEMTKLCAEATELKVHAHEDRCYFVKTEVPLFSGLGHREDYRYPYDPLHDDAQAMALLEMLVQRFGWKKTLAMLDEIVQEHDIDTNLDGMVQRAIVICVAKMQAAKSGATL